MQKKYKQTKSKTNAGQHFLQQQFDLVKPDGETIDIPVGGAMELLAIGDVGIILWRQKRIQVKNELARRTQAHLANDKDGDSINSKTNKHEKK